MSTTLTPRTDAVVLFQGDDDQKIRDLATKAEALKERADRLRSAEGKRTRLMGEAVESEAVMAEWRAVAQEHDDAKRDARERAVVVTVERLPRKKWRSLVDEHPPREDVAGDARFGVNLKTFPDALVPPSITDPTFDTPVDRDEFLDNLSDQQFEDIFWAAFGANRRGGADPQDFLVARTSSTGTES